MTTFQERFSREIHGLLDETFENVHGIYLDRGTSLCETLAGVTAEQASRPVSRRGNTVVAHVWHLTFYLDLLEWGLRGGDTAGVDWEETWRTTEATADGWGAMRLHLQAVYRTIRATLGTPDIWDNEGAVGGAMAMAAHTAYHLGAIRQILVALSDGIKDSEGI